MAFLVAFSVALLSGMGVGGGGLYLLYLVSVMGLSQYTAQGINLIFFATATLASSLWNFRTGRLPFRLLLPLFLAGGAAALLGAMLTRFFAAGSARYIFGWFLIAGGLYTLLTRLFLGSREKSGGEGAKSLDKGGKSRYNKTR